MVFLGAEYVKMKSTGVLLRLPLYLSVYGTQYKINGEAIPGFDSVSGLRLVMFDRLSKIFNEAVEDEA
ncbi:hypothetical protein MNBD_GAMMA17-769 [hydrothermal vent metagenome]|uniref:Uncharacterized protein n=1 Tax=hydrothermal vent metagenome TaxID=652676 RepID=A0A3B0ZD35_9ZZZZ